MKAKKPAPAKHAKSAKPKTAVTPAPAGKSKPPKKPTKQGSVLPLMNLDGDGDLPPPGGGGGVPGVEAVPKITFPLGNATVPAGMSLGVMVSTNRADLGYVVTIQDITPPGPAPAPTSFPGPNPTTNPFSVNIPAANLAAGRQYRIVVTLDAASAGNAHTDNSVTINTAP